MKSVLFLDTQKTCFLCLQESPRDDDTFEGIKTTEVCFQKICRYLNINQGAVLLKGLEDAGLDLSAEEKEEARQGNKSNFSVRLCPSCSSVITKLSELLEQLEMTKMLIHHKVEVLHRILNVSTGVVQPQDGDKLTKNMLKNGNLVEARMVEELRKETIQQCAKKVTVQATSLPRVRLEKLKSLTVKVPPSPCHGDMISDKESESLEDIASLMDDLVAPENSQNSPSSPEIQPKPVSTPVPTITPTFNAPARTHSRKSHHVLRDAKCDLETTLPLPPKSPDLTLPDLGQDNFVSHKKMIRETCLKLFTKKPFLNQHECSLCKKTFCTLDFSRLRPHVVHSHPEYIFSRTRLPDVPLGKFKECCKLAVQTVVNDLRQGAGKIVKEGYYCTLCNDNHKFKSNRYDFGYHVVMEHYSAVAEVVVRLQGGQTVFTSLPIPTTSNSLGVKIWVCEFKEGGCGQRFSKRWMLNKHKQEACENRKAKRLFLCRSSVGGCGKTFFSRSSLYRHCAKCSGPPTKRSRRTEINGNLREVTSPISSSTVVVPADPLGMDNDVETDTTSPELTDCLAGQKTPLSEPSTPLSTNLIKRELKESPIVMVDTGLSIDQSKAQILPDRAMVRATLNSLFRATELPNQYECLLCKRVFPNADIRPHIVGCHLEVLYENTVLPHLSPEKFREYCKTAMETVVNSFRSRAGGETETGNFCSLCNNYRVTKRSIFHFQYHLVSEHYRVVAEEIRGLQSNPEMTNASKAVFQLRRHKKNYCVKSQNWEKDSISRPSVKRFVCKGEEGCGQKFSCAPNLHRHRKNSCPKRNVKQVIYCDVRIGGCGKKFSSQLYLKEHCQRTKCPRASGSMSSGGVISSNSISADYQQDGQLTMERDPLEMGNTFEENTCSVENETAASAISGEAMICDWATKTEPIVGSVEDANECEFESFV